MKPKTKRFIMWCCGLALCMQSTFYGILGIGHNYWLIALIIGISFMWDANISYWKGEFN